jgi:class 3 adenylate cyclase/tetratricopeptide (TPR) repeat protein
MTSGRRVDGERRILTMLFCDVVGSTAMAERLDPEDWTEIMNGAYEHLIAPVTRYEGTLARLMGDAIFAFFGAPVGHEDDPVRAVAAGLEIVDGIAAYRERVRSDLGLELNVRVGINTGSVVVGEVGSKERVEYTAMGDAVNVAARMEQTAEPGTVQITAETHRLVAHLFEVEPRGPVEVKGKALPVVAYRVLGRKAEPGPVRAHHGDAALVGREREMAELRRAVDDALDGRGRMVSLVGEAGLGKSRLILETRAYWSARSPESAPSGDHLGRMWETWQCVSYDTTRPYAQYRRVLGTIAGIADTDPPDVVRSKLARTAHGGSPEEVDSHLRVWRSLFSIQEPGEEPLEGEAFRRAVLELVSSSTRDFTTKPRLLVFEDLHWCDEASTAVLMETAKLVEDAPCLYLFAFRPDRQAQSWRLKQWLETEYPHRSVELDLSPLSEAESIALIDELVPGSARSDEVRARILERTEGNPLFVEEMTAAVLERGLADDAIPTTLQALITSRLDTLDEPTRRTLELASVIGRSFPEPVLAAVAGDGDELRRQLRTLERVGLVAEVARIPEREYAFHHSLTQDATYGTILRRDRQELHLRVARAFEQLYANRVEEFAPLLVRHFEEGGDDERTLRYATLAGDHAARLYANAEAVTHYTSAIDAARRLGWSEQPLGHVYPGRGRALELAGRFDEAVENYEGMHTLAEEAGDRGAVLEADLGLATLFSTPGPKIDRERGRDLLERTLVLAQELGERRVEAKALWNLMILNIFSGGDIGEAARFGERSAEIARELGERQQLAFALNDLWRPYVAFEDLGAARATLEEAEGIWRELGNLPMLGENLASSSQLSRLAGNDDEALALAEEAYRINEDIGNAWGQAYALMGSYPVHLDRGEVDAAMQAMRRAIELAERGGFVPAQAIVRGDLAGVYANLGDLDRAKQLAADALAVASEQMPMTLPAVMAAKAEIHLLEGELEQALDALDATRIERLPEPIHSLAMIRIVLLRARIASASRDPARALELAESILDPSRAVVWREEGSPARGIRPFQAEALLVKGGALAALRRWEEAEAALREARAEAERARFNWVLWKVLAELGRVAAARGEADAGIELLREAREVVERIAENIGDAELRDRFLSAPAVRELDS